jgi:hypothetical protein
MVIANTSLASLCNGRNKQVTFLLVLDYRKTTGAAS